MPRARSLRTLSITTQSSLNTRMASPTPGGPPSPTMSDATNASQLHFGLNGPEKIITRADLRNSSQAYENLLSSCAAYREALIHMSRATAAFADAMGTCASLKGASYEAGSRMQAASGLHYLMGNHWHVLSDSLDKKFEKPLRQHLENYRAVVSERSAAYEHALREKSRIIRQTEMENMNVGKRKNRNLQTFREALAVLQRQVEELDEMRLAHYQEVMEHEEEVWDVVQGKVSLVVRSTLDVLDRFTAKASDPVIEPMLQAVPDPFDSYGPPKAEDQIFSILPPLAIFNSSSSNANSARSSPHVGTVEVDATPAFAAGTSSWGHNHASDGYFSGDADWSGTGNISTSPPTSSPEPITSSPPPLSRSKSPTSPLRRHSDLMGTSSSSGASASRAHPRKSVSGLRKVLSVISESIPSASYGYGNGSRKVSQTQVQPQKSKSQTLPSASSIVRETSQDTIRNKALPKDPESDYPDHDHPDPDPDSDAHLADVSSDTIGGSAFGSEATTTTLGANGLTSLTEATNMAPNLQRSVNYDRPLWAVHSRGASSGSVTYNSAEGISSVLDASRSANSAANIEWPRMDTPPGHDSPLVDRSISDGAQLDMKASA